MKMLKSLVVAAVVLAVTAVPLTAGDAPDPTPAGKTVVVKMLDDGNKMRFEPANVEVKRGDVIRFVLEGSMPHNVEFKKAAGLNLGKSMMGPYLTKRGQSYEVKVDERFGKGTFEYVCTPHAMMGMKGTVKVTG